MRIGCSAVCYAHLSLEEALAKISSAGFNYLELLAIRGWAYIDAQEVSAQEVRKVCRDYNLNLIGLHAGGLNAVTQKTAGESIDYIKSVIDLSADLGVSKVIFTGGHWKGEYPVLTRFIEALQKLAKYIEGMSIQLCVENHYQTQLEKIEDIQRVMREVNHRQVGLNADTGHFISSRISLDSVIKVLGEKIRYVHIKDQKGTQSVGLGRGEIDNRIFVKKLKQLGYNDELSMELEVKDRENIDQYLEEGYEYMKALVH